MSPSDDCLDFAEEYARHVGDDEAELTCMQPGCDEDAEWKLGSEWLCDTHNRKAMR